MYFLLILFISPAFGQQLDDLLNNSKLLKKVSESLEEPENYILEAALNPSSAPIDGLTDGAERFIRELLNSHPELWLEENFTNSFQTFNEAKFYLRETRQGLKELAHRTVTDKNQLQILLEAVDESDNSVSLRRTLELLKNKMIETLESLE